MLGLDLGNFAVQKDAICRSLDFLLLHAQETLSSLVQRLVVQTEFLLALLETIHFLFLDFLELPLLTIHELLSFLLLFGFD